MLRLHNRNRKGFTLIELMIVVAIIGILAAIAIPNFLRFQAKSKQSEARELLSSIYTAEVAYYAENNVFSDFATIGYTASSTPKYYTSNTYTSVALQQGFTGTMNRSIDSDNTEDEWNVTQASREPNNNVNDVITP